MCAQESTVQVKVFYWVQEKGLLDQISKTLAYPIRGDKVEGHGETFCFTPRQFGSEKELAGEVEMIQRQRKLAKDRDRAEAESIGEEARSIRKKEDKEAKVICVSDPAGPPRR